MRRENRVREMPSIMPSRITSRIGNPNGFNPLGYLVLGTIVGVCGGGLYATWMGREAQTKRYVLMGGMAGLGGGATLALIK